MPSCSSLIGARSRKGTLLAMNHFDYELSLGRLDDGECQYPSAGGWRGGRLWSLSALDESICTVLIEWLIYRPSILTLQIFPRLGNSHTKAVLSGTRIISGIVRRCLHSRTYRTILGLHRHLWKKSMESEPPGDMVWGRGLEPLVVPTRWDILGVALYGSPVWPYGVGVDFTDRSIRRHLRVYLLGGWLKHQCTPCNRQCINHWCNI